MKLLNKILLTVVTASICSNAFAYSMPPVSNDEIKEHADHLISQNLFKSAKKYYAELNKRGDVVNATWGLTLVDLAEKNNKQALAKVNYLLKQDKVKRRTLEDLEAELLITLAEYDLENKSFATSSNYLSDYFKKYNGHYKFQERALSLKEKLGNPNYNQRQINIGVILPLSGKLGHIGKQIKQALIISLYDEKLSNITLYFEDNHSTQDGSITAAMEIINKSPNLIIGPILRDNVLAANTIISNTSIPVFSFSNDESIAGGNIFLNNTNLRQESYEIARFAYDNGNYKMTCLTPTNPYGQIQKKKFEDTAKKLNAGLKACADFDSSNIDINPALKKLLEIDKHERTRKAKLRKLEREFKKLGNAMDDEKIKEMEELKNPEFIYDIDFNAIFIPTSASKISIIAPQLAFYDIDFSNGVLFLGTTSWDNNKILKNKGEHLHFSRFLSLKSDEFKLF
ncbi:MAG TPA: hypothetical protein DCL21_03615, partial [Alphaproteobacteria bacterium]|nr:hypothetical protein [Alphaproteobacteria bacterium]